MSPGLFLHVTFHVSMYNCSDIDILDIVFDNFLHPPPPDLICRMAKIFSNPLFIESLTLFLLFASTKTLFRTGRQQEDTVTGCKTELRTRGNK